MHWWCWWHNFLLYLDFCLLSLSDVLYYRCSFLLFCNVLLVFLTCDFAIWRLLVIIYWYVRVCLLCVIAFECLFSAFGMLCCYLFKDVLLLLRDCCMCVCSMLSLFHVCLVLLALFVYICLASVHYFVVIFACCVARFYCLHYMCLYMFTHIVCWNCCIVFIRWK